MSFFAREVCLLPLEKTAPHCHIKILAYLAPKINSKCGIYGFGDNNHKKECSLYPIIRHSYLLNIILLFFGESKHGKQKMHIGRKEKT
jgi:hypothetical protein